MNRLDEELNLKIESIEEITLRSRLINSFEGKYILKEMTPNEIDAYAYLAKTKYQHLRPLLKREIDNKVYYLFNYIERDSKPQSKPILMLREMSKLVKNTAVLEDCSAIDEFRFKKMVMITNERFNAIELFIRQIELQEIKNDDSWIYLSKYHIVLDAKREIYNLLKKLPRDAKKESLTYSFLQGSPMECHFKDQYFLTFSKARRGYYVNDLYKAYVELEYLSFDIKHELDKVLSSSFSKRYFKLMVLYTYIIGMDSMKISKSPYAYIRYTSCLAKTMALFKDYK